VVELVRDIGNTGSAVCAHHAQQIELDLDLGVIGAFHIFVNKQIRHHGRIGSAVVVNGEHCLSSDAAYDLWNIIITQ
jgi:hypothetical protein